MVPRITPARKDLTFTNVVQTEVKDPSAQPTADDFLAREKALLGDDAELFTTTDDSAALVDAPAAGSTFESQFPDLADPSAVCQMLGC